MSIPLQLTINGAVVVGPILPTSAPFPSGSHVQSLQSAQQVFGSTPKAFSVNSPATYVDLLTGTGVAQIRALVFRVRAGTVSIRVTSSAMVDAEFTVSDLLVITNPYPGSEWTALAVKGVADLEMVIAGL